MRLACRVTSMRAESPMQAASCPSAPGELHSFRCRASDGNPKLWIQTDPFRKLASHRQDFEQFLRRRPRSADEMAKDTGIMRRMRIIWLVLVGIACVAMGAQTRKLKSPWDGCVLHRPMRPMLALHRLCLPRRWTLTATTSISSIPSSTQRNWRRLMRRLRALRTLASSLLKPPTLISREAAAPRRFVFTRCSMLRPGPMREMEKCRSWWASTCRTGC